MLALLSRSKGITGIGSAKDGPFALVGPQKGPPTKPLMSVLDVNLTGSIYTARLAQHYLMKNKFSDSNAIVFMGSMGERPPAPV
jgi:hypothetical protein